MDIYTKAVKPSDIEIPKNSVADPIFQTSVYSFKEIDEVDELLGGQREGYSYTRGGNPNYDGLAQFIASLENAERAVVTSSGTASLLAAILALQPKPCTIYLPREIYGGTVGICRRILGPMGYNTQWVDTHNLESLRNSLSESPSILIAESISNPLGRVSPLRDVIEVAHSAGCLVIVDNTFATPFHANPLEWGADLIVHSATKFIGGHSDVVLGLIAGSATTIRVVQEIVDVAGFTPDPFASWLALRGARTLALRMERASQNALTLASTLEGMRGVDRVYYPGLRSHPDHDIAKDLLGRGFGAIISLSLKGGYNAVQEMIHRLELVRFVPSLGDVTTTLSHPVVASHRELSEEEKQIVGIDPSIVRLSIGIETVGDIIHDFEQALS
ncbi:trans-sulfuration enzyme family protein [Alicyclobacillus sp. ALC3]|uniref:trans-sulfuration enzyme family protein n=1 Tax=Alicyclobacillus sp. ALC3 TaxID=2796143 RepID=UPI0023793239|nr:aminotransferase class I/II-fold pyridoxal phosphate-dependent enzyme [Alicyclobacillus sp. ALC3]WDL98556.1 aminotransferase class I/II-fold pyridoxal phosphate-dependent enzyme [Alicyclobacillus sp. ALC3]